MKDIVIDASVSWTSSTTLILDAYRSVEVNKSVAVTGQGGLSITTNDGAIDGAFLFGKSGSIQFWSLSSSLTIDSAAYTLVNNISTLASAVSANPAGNYALANNYEASSDGTYPNAPVPTTFTGKFEGLGNRIFDLTINDPNQQTVDNLGLFAQLSAGGTIRDINLLNVSITAFLGYEGGLVGRSFGRIENGFASGSISQNLNGVAGGLAGTSDGQIISSHSDVQVSNGTVNGGLVGDNGGSITNSFATGAVSGGYQAGGLVASNGGTIQLCFATGQVSVLDGADVGGLVAVNAGVLNQSFATGSVSGGASVLGGLTGLNEGGGSISQAYATGAVTSGSSGVAGGLLGYDNTGSTIAESYSAGAVSNGGGGYVGGFVGFDNTQSGSIKSAYWDTETSGVTNKSQGAGNIPNDSGIKGESTEQLQAGLPKGFNKKVWTENPDINGGLPYLIALHPK